MRENLPEVLPPFPNEVIPARKTKNKELLVRVKPPGRFARELRKAALHMQMHGFTAEFKFQQRACFIGTFDRLLGGGYDDIAMFFGDLIFDDPRRSVPWTGVSYLRFEGWNTKDAVAALEIAADYAEALGI